MKTDSLGDRMKKQYEHRTRIFLPRRTYTFMRVDGKAFHTYTKGCKRPFDEDLMTAMDEAAKELCKTISGCKLAYVQSDEITTVSTDFEEHATQAWFDNNLQKIVSVAASTVTSRFNQVRAEQNQKTTATFDCRAWTIAERDEVLNCLVWRQQDATRNSIQMAAQSMFSHKELIGKNTSILQDMMHEKGVNWNDYPIGFKRGRLIRKVYYESGQSMRSKWVVEDTPIFTQDREFLYDLIPKLG
jgi:tRNA(His) 5'-end guanylyltransferase